MDDPVAAFRVGDALREGRSRRSVDDPRWARPFAGLRAELESTSTTDERHPLDIARDRLVTSARMFAVHMHEQEFFSHRTAAVLWELPLPARRFDDRVDVSVLAPRRAPRGRGVHGRQLSGRQVSTILHPSENLRVTTPASTWAQLGGLIPHIYDLTALADAVIRAPRIPGPLGRPLREPHATLAELAVELARGRRIGVRTLREALERSRLGAASRGETWTRLTIIDAGLPEPTLDHDVYDPHGQFVGCVDLAYPRLRIAVEYEGDQHRVDPRQWNRDIEKYDRLAELGWRVIRVTRTMLFSHPGQLTARVQAAIRSRA